MMDEEAVRSLLSDGLGWSAVPGAQVGLVRGPDRLVVSCGVRDIADGAPVTSETAFHAGSLGKSLTGLVVLEAARRHDLDVDTPCAEQGEGQWPETPRAILTQTTGRPNLLPGPDEPLHEFVARSAELPLVHEPGRFSYCNAGWSALDLLLRQRCGRSFEQSVHDLLAWPKFDVPAGASSGHMSMPGRPPQPVPLDSWPAASAAGSRWWATADELLDYAELHLRPGQGDVDPDVVRMVRTPAAALPGATVFDSWAHGWAVWERGLHHAYGWAGYTSGHRSFLRCFPEQDAALVVLTNSAGSLFGPPGGSALFDALLPRLLDVLGIPALPEPTYTHAPRPAQALAGHFGPLTVEADGQDDLMVLAPAFGVTAPTRCTRLGGNTFAPSGNPPGSTPLAVDDDLLYLGPFAFPRHEGDT